MVATLTSRARRGAGCGERRSAWPWTAPGSWPGLRELPKSDFVLVLAQARRELSAIGANLAAAGSSTRPTTCSSWTSARSRAAGRGRDLRDVVAARGERLRPGAAAPARARGCCSPTAPSRRRRQARRRRRTGALAGTAASAGTVTGPARVVLDPAGARLVPGEILVAPSTDPGWTPLFLTAGGLVMEMGGANSHGAVVAREYGIPAVVGVPDATGRISTGQQVEVDGTHGLVRSLASPG